MKSEYDNMTTHDKRKILMANAIDNQKSDAKKLNILMEEDMSPKKKPSNLNSTAKRKESSVSCCSDNDNVIQKKRSINETPNFNDNFSSAYKQ